MSNHALRIFFRIDNSELAEEMTDFLYNNCQPECVRKVGQIETVTMIQFKNLHDKHLFQLLFQDKLDKNNYKISDHHEYNLNNWVDYSVDF